MLAVRIQNQTYRVTNATLDRLLGAEQWRRMSRSLLQKSIQAHHAAGRLMVDGQRLRCPSASEEAEQRLRVTDDRDEMLRNGLLYVAAQIATLTAEVRSLRESLEFDTSAANAALARARPERAPRNDERERESARAHSIAAASTSKD
jgi:hypothetical protein